MSGSEEVASRKPQASGEVHNAIHVLKVFDTSDHHRIVHSKRIDSWMYLFWC